MAKLAMLGAILGALLVMSHAVAANRAIITTVDIDEPENRRHHGRSCYEHVQRQDFKHCEQLFKDVTRYGGQGGSGCWGGHGGQGECMSEMTQSRHFRPCCQQPRQMEDQCRCEGLRQVMRQQMGEFRGRGSQDMMRYGAQGTCLTCVGLVLSTVTSEPIGTELVKLELEQKDQMRTCMAFQ